MSGLPRLLVVPVALVLCAAEDRDAPAPVPADAFTGVSIAGNATDVFAPESGFRIAGWSSWGGPAKLLELAADGTAVSQGDVVARFDFQGKDAQSHVQERMANAEAKSSQRRLETKRAVDSLQLDKQKKEIEARLAQIDVDKERAVSRRQADVYRIARAIADFEVQAVGARIEAAQREDVAENEHQDLLVARAKATMEHYKFYERRAIVIAPHDGVVRHAFNAQERRKVQKGDAVQSGMRVLSVAKDARLAARFYVPEHRVREVEVGTEVIVTTAGSGSAQEHRARVVQIDYFPQELGFLLENGSLPNAREKAFAVRADFVDTPSALGAGTELLVRAVAAQGARP